MRVNPRNFYAAIFAVCSMICKAQENTEQRILTKQEETNLLETYMKVLQNEEEIRPVLDSLRGIVA